MTAKSKSKASTKQERFIEEAVANIEARTRREIEELRARVEDGIDEVTTKASARANKLEAAFDKRVAQAYNRMGMPSRADIETLENKLDSLIEAVEALSKQNGATTGDSSAKRAPAKSASAKKASAKKASTKKAPAKKAAPKKAARKSAKK